MKLKHIFAVAGMALMFSACDLDQYPFSEVAADDYVTNDAALNNLVNGTYNALHKAMYYQWAMTELRSDNARLHLNNSTSNNNKLVEALDQSVPGADNAFISDYWNGCYTVIYRANTVLSYLDVAESAKTRNMYEGEALFLRSLEYFDLVRLFGPVFKVTNKVTNEEARDMQRSTVDEIYALIEGDLERIIAQELLPVKQSDALLGRADLIAAKALLAKVYATHYSLGDEKYARAAELCKDVLASDNVGNPMSGDDLVPYKDVFSTANEMNKEIIFAVRYIGGLVGLGSPFGNLFAPVNNGANVIVGTSYNYDHPSVDLISAYEANGGDDVRLDVNIAQKYFNKTTGQWVEGERQHFCRKYLNIDQESNPIASQWEGDADWPVIRVADIALLYAELTNEISGPTNDAFRYLNMVRERAGLEALTREEAPARYEFRQAVRNERRLELAFENQRWFDLMRWGIARETVNAYLASEAFYQDFGYTVSPIADWQTLLPIPIDVININPEVAQNFGY